MRCFSIKKSLLRFLVVVFSFFSFSSFSQILLSEQNPTFVDQTFESVFAPITLSIKNNSGYKGQIVCVDVLANGFSDVLTMSFTLTFNNMIVVIDHVEGFGLPNLDMTNFVFNSGFGAVGVTWNDDSNTGISVNDGDKLFSVCFKVIGNVGETSLLTITSIPTPIIITDVNSNGAGVSVNTKPGQFTVISEPIPLEVNFTQILDYTCLHKGSIEMAVSGGNLPLKFKWSNSESTKDIYNLVAGDYSVTITDNSQPPMEIIKTKTIIENRNIPEAVVGEDIITNCMYAVALDGSGSTSGDDIRYQWSTENGDLGEFTDKNTATALDFGDYQLIVVDVSNGCMDTAKISLILNPDLELPNAGKDTMLCTDVYHLAANLPDGFTGIWKSDLDQMISNPMDPETIIGDFKDGDNLFTWTLSSDDCPDLGTDTVVISYLSMPEAINDTLNFRYIDNQVNFDVSDNDIINSTYSTWSYTFEDFETDGNFSQNEMTGQVEFSKNPEFSGLISFDYEVCSNVCEDYCSKATVFLNFAERFVPEFPDLDSIPVFNAFTPNGDGINDVLIFDILTDYPEDSKDSELLVYNRWGDIVFSEKPYKNDWAGTNNGGKKLADGTYYYVLTINLNQNKIIRGDVTILRW